METDITKVSQPIAQLVQVGLRHLNYYSGTTRGIPGAKTVAAFEAYKNRGLAKDDPPESPEGSPVAMPMPRVGEVIVEVAKSALGVREEGANTGKWVQIFQAATWLPGTGWAWCAAFVCWVVREAFERLEITDIVRPRTAGAWDFENWAKAGGRAKSSRVQLYKGRDIPEDILPGDILVFSFSHIGIAVRDLGSVVETIEGNTNGAGSREGDGTYLKQRADSLIRSVIRIV